MSFLPDSISEIDKKINPQIGREIRDIIENNSNLKNFDSVRTMLSWHKEAKELSKNLPKNELDRISEDKDLVNLAALANLDQDSFFSKISNIMVDELLKNISLPFVELITENIRISTIGKKKGVKFDLNMQLDSIKPYIKFAKKVDKINVASVKIKFQIDSTLEIKNIEIFSSDKDKKIKLEKIIITIVVALINFDSPIISSNDFRELGSRTFEIDLSSNKDQN